MHGAGFAAWTGVATRPTARAHVTAFSGRTLLLLLPDSSAENVSHGRIHGATYWDVGTNDRVASVSRVLPIKTFGNPRTLFRVSSRADRRLYKLFKPIDVYEHIRVPPPRHERRRLLRGFFFFVFSIIIFVFVMYDARHERNAQIRVVPIHAFPRRRVPVRASSRGHIDVSLSYAVYRPQTRQRFRKRNAPVSL